MKKTVAVADDVVVLGILLLLAIGIITKDQAADALGMIYDSIAGILSDVKNGVISAAEAAARIINKSEEGTVAAGAGEVSAEEKKAAEWDWDVDNLPEGWTKTENNGRIHVRDAEGNIRSRIGPPDAKTNYQHQHRYDGNGNSLDADGNIVPYNSPDAHIPYGG